MSLVVELADDQLCVRAIHRLARTGSPTSTCATRVAAPFVGARRRPQHPDGVAALEAAMDDRGGLGLVDGRGLALLEPLADARPPPWTSSRRRCTTSTRRASTSGCAPSSRSATLAYRNDAATVARPGRRRVRPTPRSCCAPVSVASIRAAAAAGVRMPEKTTFFAPKPRTGMVMRGLDD